MSDDSLKRDLKEIHGYYLEESEPERLPQSEDDAGEESDDGDFLRSVFSGEKYASLEEAARERNKEKEEFNRQKQAERRTSSWKS